MPCTRYRTLCSRFALQLQLSDDLPDFFPSPQDLLALCPPWSWLMLGRSRTRLQTPGYPVTGGALPPQLLSTSGEPYMARSHRGVVAPEPSSGAG